jgi:hypothetical protein
MRTSWAYGMVVGVAWLAMAGCGAKPPTQAEDEFAPPGYEGGKDDIEQPGVTEDPEAVDKGRSSDSPTTQAPPGMEGLDEDQKAQFKVALRRGTTKAAQCPGVVKNAPLGKGDVQVVFDGKKGRVDDALVGSPWAGTEVEGCIKRSFIGEIVLPFDGPNRTLSQEVELKAGAAPAADPKKKP